MDSSVTHCFNFITALRGFHAYQNTMNWNLCIGQIISFNREFDNKHYRFAACDKAMLPAKISTVVVGYVPKELSRHLVCNSEGSKIIGICG